MDFDVELNGIVIPVAVSRSSNWAIRKKRSNPLPDAPIFDILISTISIPLRGEVPGGYFLAVFTGMAFVTWPLSARIIRSEVIETMILSF